MVRGDKAAKDEVDSPADENEEIDRIMKEIEDLEKKMDSAPEPTVSEAAPAPAEPPMDSPVEPDPTPTAKVVSLRPAPVAESMAETDAVPVVDEPMMRSTTATADSSLSMKIGGCAEVSLEFTRSGMTVTLACGDEGLSITTDSGAEFRIPFKRDA